MRAHDIITAMYDGQTLIFGHRGAKAYAPMNTLPAFELAAAQGAHGIELDVHRSKDGYPVIVHDFVVDATSDGVGAVVDMTLAELKALDAGAWFDPRFAGTRIPTLDEVFETVGARLFVNVEIKSESVDTDGVEQVVADCIARHNMDARVIVSSFNPLTLRRFRALLPDVPIGFLYYSDSPAEVWDVIADVPYEAYHPYFAEITPDMVAEHVRLGRVINTWTVNDPAQAVALHDMGVRGIITDAPDVILNALANR
ncbi:MAG: glycerophosphodiester phosphodiesterase family protein [Chloroflexota bacterium]|nr:glycerophosphodiester phosphodiesterase family protein [Chloroflexota bacterium]